MNCTTFEQQLEDLLERRLSRDEELAARAHAERCDACRELLVLAEIGAAPELDLAPAVLARTTGPSCERARDSLCDFVDANLDRLGAALVRGHLDACPDCARVAKVLTELRQDLPRLAVLDPGPDFTAAVLRRTRTTVAFRRLWAGGRHAWHQVVLRPRFALEAAYVLTLFALLVLGVPGESVAALSRQVSRVATVELPQRIEGTLRQTGNHLRSGAEEAWNESGAPVAENARQSLADAAAYSSLRVSELKSLAGTLWARVASESTDQVDNAPGADSRRQGTEQDDDRQ